MLLVIPISAIFDMTLTKVEPCLPPTVNTSLLCRIIITLEAQICPTTLFLKFSPSVEPDSRYSLPITSEMLQLVYF